MTAPGRVFLNVASGIDGKISTASGEKFRFASDEDRQLMQELRAQADAVVIGGGTLRAEDPRLVVKGEGRRQPWNVVVSARLEGIGPEARFFTSPGVTKWVFTSVDADPARVERLQPCARVSRLPGIASGGLDLGRMLQELRGAGCRHVLVEGGGELNFAMLEQNLVDEIYWTLCPVVLGGREAPGSFTGRGFASVDVRRLELLEQRTNVQGEIFLHYRVRP